MERPKIKDFKPEYKHGFAESSSVIKQYSKAQDLYIDHLETINYTQCCMGETELDEDVSVNIQHKSLGKFKLVKKQDSETEQLCIKCKESPANRGLGKHKLVCSDCWNSLCD